MLDDNYSYLCVVRTDMIRTVLYRVYRPTENDGIPNTAGFRWFPFFLEDLQHQQNQKIIQPMNNTRYSASSASHFEQGYYYQHNVTIYSVQVG